MYSSRTATISVAVLTLSSLAGIALSKPPAGGASIRIVAPQRFQVADLCVLDAAVIDESTIILVGTRTFDDEDNITTRDVKPNGAILDLTTKTFKPFTNGHTAQICSMSVARGRIVTVSDTQDPMLRVWDLKANKSADPIKIEVPDDEMNFKDYAVACLHGSDRVAVRVEEQISVIDLAKPEARQHYLNPLDKKAFLYGPIAVSRDDLTLACCTVNGPNLIYWDTKNRKTTIQAMSLEGTVDNIIQSTIDSIHFLSNNSLLLCRNHRTQQEVPEGLDESKTDAVRRAIVKVRFPDGQVEPLGLGQTAATRFCAVDPTETWLATVGSSPPDKPTPAVVTQSGELRVYNLATKKLVYREQTNKPLPLTWVAFTPSGKRLVATCVDGTVHWWDVQAK